jgi:hypothetical protein
VELALVFYQNIMGKYKLVFLVIVVGFFLALVISMNNPSHHVQEIKDGYNGVLTRKYFLKANHFVIKTSRGEVDVSLVTKQFEENVEVGDSIIKIPDENYCLIGRRDKPRIRVFYIFIPQSIRSDFRWPEKWKDKWMESSE